MSMLVWRMLPTAVGFLYSVYFITISDKSTAADLILVTSIMIMASTIAKSGADLWIFAERWFVRKAIITICLPVTLILSLVGVYYLQKAGFVINDFAKAYMLIATASVMFTGVLIIGEMYKCQPSTAKLSFVLGVPLFQLIFIAAILLLGLPDSNEAILYLTLGSTSLVLLINFITVKYFFHTKPFATASLNLTWLQLGAVYLNGALTTFSANLPLIICGVRFHDSVPIVRLLVRTVYLSTFNVVLLNIRSIQRKSLTSHLGITLNVEQLGKFFLLISATALIVVTLIAGEFDNYFVITLTAILLAYFGSLAGNIQYELSLEGYTREVFYINCLALTAAVILAYIGERLLNMSFEAYVLMSGIYLFSYYRGTAWFATVKFRSNGGIIEKN